MMRSATDFLPPVMRTLMNFETSWLAYFGSGSTSRLGISLRRGIFLSRSLFLRLGAYPLLRVRYLPATAGSLPTRYCGFVNPAPGRYRCSSCLGAFSTIFRAPLLTVFDACGIQAPAHHVIAHAR